jgi:hypothetical protein
LHGDPDADIFPIRQAIDAKRDVGRRARRMTDEHRTNNIGTNLKTLRRHRMKRNDRVYGGAVTLFFLIVVVAPKGYGQWTKKQVEVVRSECLAKISSLGLDIDEPVGKSFCDCLVQRARELVPNPSELSREEFQVQFMLAGAECGILLDRAAEKNPRFEALAQEFAQTLFAIFRIGFIDECVKSAMTRYEEPRARWVCNCIFNKIQEKYGMDFLGVLNMEEDEILSMTESCMEE